MGSTSTTRPVLDSSVTPETVASTTAVSIVEPTVTTITEPTVIRPYIADPKICVAASASEASFADVNDGLLRPFALSGAGWHRFQIIADPNLGVDGRWALVGTIPAKFDSDQWLSPESDHYRYDTINGWPVAITTSPTGYADASIDLGGETDAYVRTYRFDLESIRALISQLSLRPVTEPFGFDYTPSDDLSGLELVLDRDDEPVDATFASLECVVEGQSIIRVASIVGDPLAQYVLILDQPYPDDIGRLGDAVVSIVDFGRSDDPLASPMSQGPPKTSGPASCSNGHRPRDPTDSSS